MTTLEFDKKVKCGPEFVALRILDNCDQLRSSGIWLPDMTEANGRLARCVIEDCGSKAADEYGLKAGDYVMIDRLSTFAHTAPVCVCRYNNVICLTDENGSEFRPVKDMAFVEPEEKDGVANLKGVYVPSGYDDRLNVGVVTAINVDDKDYDFHVGDKVVLTKGADEVQVGDRKIYIYKKDMLVCKIVED